MMRMCKRMLQKASEDKKTVRALTVLGILSGHLSNSMAYFVSDVLVALDGEALKQLLSDRNGMVCG